LEELHKAARKGDLREMKRLLDGVRNMDMRVCLIKRDSQGNTLLHHACAGGNVDVLRLLISLGCNLKAANHDENNLLHMAVLQGTPRVLKYLLKQIAINVEEKNKADKTPMMLAAERGSVTMLLALKKAGAVLSPDAVGLAAGKGCLQLVKHCILKEKLSLNHVDSKKCSVLHHAASQGNVEVIVFLLEHMKNNLGEMLLKKDFSGRTVLHVSCDNSLLDDRVFKKLVETAEMAGVLKQLIDCQDFFTGCNSCVLVSGRDKGKTNLYSVMDEREHNAWFGEQGVQPSTTYSATGTWSVSLRSASAAAWLTSRSSGGW
jgi:ankyrin repeat protein